MNYSCQSNFDIYKAYNSITVPVVVMIALDATKYPRNKYNNLLIENIISVEKNIPGRIGKRIALQ